MLKKTITYENFDGEKVTEDFFFNMTRAELAEWSLTFPSENVEAYLTELAKTNDKKALLEFIKDLIARSYGEKTATSNRFVKNDEIRSSFLASEAYSELLLTIGNNVEVATGFFNGIMPKSLMKEVQQEIAARKASSEPVPDPLETTIIKDKSHPKNDISGMSLEELKAELERRGKEG